LYAGVSLLAALSIFNAAVLYAVRGAGPVRNVAIRVALGASCARILAQVAAESAILCTAAGSAAIGIAWLLLHAVVARAPISIPRVVEVGMTPYPIGCGVVLAAAAMAAMFLAGAANTRPAVDRLRMHANVTSGRVRIAFTVGEIAACVCLLTVSSHVIREFIALRQAPIRFDSSHVITARIELPLMKAGEHVRHYPTRRLAKTALVSSLSHANCRA
jgi:hypothetical protein